MIFMYEHEGLLRLREYLTEMNPGQEQAPSELKKFAILYPDPPIDSDHAIVGRPDIVQGVYDCLTDPNLAEHLAKTFFLRTGSSEHFVNTVRERGMDRVITGGRGPLTGVSPGSETHSKGNYHLRGSRLADWRRMASCKGLK
jgi:hypothetical protein